MRWFDIGTRTTESLKPDCDFGLALTRFHDFGFRSDLGLHDILGDMSCGDTPPAFDGSSAATLFLPVYATWLCTGMLVWGFGSVDDWNEETMSE